MVSHFFSLEKKDTIITVKHMKVKIGVSNRHVHLTSAAFLALFGSEAKMTRRNDLGQPGQFATTLTVDLRSGDKKVEHVRVIGPLRSYNQVEISASDASNLGINPPRRHSGDLGESASLTLLGPNGEYFVSEGVILAKRHIHLSSRMAENLGLVDRQVVYVYRDGEYLFDCEIKICDPASKELHIDTDEATSYNLQTGDIVEFFVELKK